MTAVYTKKFQAISDKTFLNCIKFILKPKGHFENQARILWLPFSACSSALLIHEVTDYSKMESRLSLRVDRYL